MSSNKQKQTTIKLKRAEKRQTIPDGAILANLNALSHNSTYASLPKYYIDKSFTCIDCGKEEVWTASQQKWWYEVAKGPIDSIAVRCRSCRKKQRAKKA